MAFLSVANIPLMAEKKAEKAQVKALNLEPDYEITCKFKPAKAQIGIKVQ